MKKVIKKTFLQISFSFVTGLLLIFRNNKTLKNRKLFLGSLLIAISAISSGCSSGPDERITCYAAQIDTLNNDIKTTVNDTVTDTTHEDMIRCYVPPSNFQND